MVDISPIYEEIAAEFKQDEAAEEERLERIARQTPPELFAFANGKKLDVEDFLRRHSIRILRTKPRTNSMVYEIECQGSHGGYEKYDGKAFVKVFSSGGIFYGCLHKTCSHNNSDNHWRELRERYEPQTNDDARRPPQPASSERETGKLVIVRGDQVAEKPIKWMWKEYLPQGRLVHYSGNSGQAKSPVATDLAARITVGGAWPDGTPNELGPRSVVAMNIEDDIEDTIMPRFRLAGGDKSKIFCVKGTMVHRETGAVELGVALDRDMHAVTALAHSIPDLGLIVIDPITNYLGAAKMNAEEDVRRILTPLANLAAVRSIVVITIGHFNRREKGTDPLHRILGAAAFSGVARAVYAFGPDPDSDDKYSHVMTVVRGCGGEPSGLRYRTELVHDAGPDCPTNDIIRVVWCGKSNAIAADAVDPESSDVKSSEAQAAELLKELLSEGRKPCKECEEFLSSHGFYTEEGKPKLNLTRVRRLAGVGTMKFPKEGFYSWYLQTTQA